MTAAREGREHAGDARAMWIERPCGCCGSPVRRLNGPWLRYHRERSGLSLSSFARLARVSKAYVSDIERNRRELAGKAPASSRLLAQYAALSGRALQCADADATQPRAGEGGP